MVLFLDEIEYRAIASRITLLTKTKAAKVITYGQTVHM
jgi:hypothetical protein